MTLNLGGDYFNGVDFGHSNQNAPSIMGNDSKAVLYVFKPYLNQIGDVGLRPFQYMFDDNFISETQEITDLSKKGAARHSVLINEFMDSHNLYERMMPAANASMVFRGSHVSDKWRFILILTEKATGLIAGNTIGASSSNSQIRRIYTGYFQDEPFNPLTSTFGKKTLNPHSYMVITHKTIVGTAQEHGRFGQRTLINTQNSEEIIHPQLSMSLIGTGLGSGNKLHLMTPSNCVNSMERNEEGYTLATPGSHSDISRDTGAHPLPDLLEQPSHNVGVVLKGMMKYQDEVTSRGRLSTNRVNEYFQDQFEDDGRARMTLARHMSMPRARQTSLFDLDVDSRISPVDLSARVNGDLDVIDFDLERPVYYETADQMQTSVTNQYSFLIASIISPILNSAGLNAMQFEYQIMCRQGQIRDDFVTHSAEPNWPVPQNDLLAMVKAVEVELTNGVFGTIFASMGDFHVAVSANATGMTIVRLNLVGQGYRSQADFELPSCMGGLISPLLGDEHTNAGNSEAIELLYSVATGTNEGYPRNFNEDDKNFADYAGKEFPWQQLTNSDLSENELYVN